MKIKIVFLIAKQFFKKTFSTKGLFGLLGLYLIVLCHTTTSSWKTYDTKQHIVEHHQEKSRESWDNNPNKHPHRMAHFGSFVFRKQHPLSIFDSGIENYTGNAIFLEAHRQNTANFSEASLSTGLVRFGDLNIAMLLQLILPLIVFFIGYSSITFERENGTFKIIYIQGASIKDILLGKSLGLFLITSLFLLPSLACLWSISLFQNFIENSSTVARSVIISIAYILFYIILCCITVITSGKSENSNKALLTLLGYWLLFFVMIPKTTYMIGQAMYPNLSKIEFRAAIESKVLKIGNSHDPNDPHFKKLKDSILKIHKVTNIKNLPFNYGGFIMGEGERQSATIYKEQHQQLIDTYRKQNSITNGLVMLNPYLAINKLSMSFSGTDFETYANFLLQTEKYRYKQSQYMNNLQMKYISSKAKSSEGKVNVVSNDYWKSFPKFYHQYTSVIKIAKTQLLSVVGLVMWLLLSFLFIHKFSHRFKII